MPEKFARVIIDISHEKVDRPFSYAIPQSLEDQIKAGCRVRIPFGSGNRQRQGKTDFGIGGGKHYRRISTD